MLIHLKEMRTNLILLCGGEGHRLRPLTNDLIPKSLVKVSHKPLIEYSIDSMSSTNVTKFIFAIDYKSEQMKAWINENYKGKIPYEYTYQIDDGIVGAIQSAIRRVDSDDFIVCNTDETRYKYDLQDALETHVKNKRVCTMIVSKENMLFRHRYVQINKKNLITQTYLKNQYYKSHPAIKGYVNNGMLLFNTQVMLQYIRTVTEKSWSAIIDPLVQKRQVYAYQHNYPGYFNVGTPREYEEACSFYSRHLNM